jgi:S1-C subfamily serine protease
LGASGPTVDELAHATVQILALTRSGGGLSPVWSGSGSLISADGLILTNAHVVDDRGGEFSDLGVAVLLQADQPPELMYLAEVAAVDYALDLAVLRLVSDLEGNPIQVDLPFVQLGDSDAVAIGEGLKILGYPGIGGDTITFTEGVVSGFTSERNVEGRAWIKTDATIAGGNSGGMAANAEGELVGIPTQASSGAEDSEIVDCRLIADTNGDGRIDDRDTCVPIGGFINGLRPINLAFPLIEAAERGVAYQGGPAPSAAQGGSYDLTDTLLANLVFSDGVTDDDQPTGIYDALPGGLTNVCAFWDYEAMADGMRWSAYWFVNGSLDQDGSILDQTWNGGDTGNWWVCIYNNDGLSDGLYELVLEIEGEVLLNDAVFVGGDHPPVEFILVNQSGTAIYYVLLSPSQAQNWGQDELDSRETLASGGSRVFQVPAGTYDLLLLDSEFNHILEEYGLDLTGDTTYTVSGAQQGTAPQPQGEPTTLRLVNNSNTTVCFVFISPVTSSTWGEDWLGSTETIPSGSSRDFEVSQGSWDLQAQDCNRNTLDEQYGVEIGPEGQTWSLTP